MDRVKPEVIGYWPGKRWKQNRAVYNRQSLSPTLIAKMGETDNFVYILEVNGEEK